MSSNYENPDLVKVVVEKNRNFRNQLLQGSCPSLDLTSIRTLLGIALCTPHLERPLRVLDFGGGGGFHYFIARAATLPKQHLIWRVVETSKMVKLASHMLSNDELKFSESIESAAADLGGEIDLVFASSVLQYCENPLYILEQLASIGSKNLFITRTPFSASEQQYAGIQKSRLKDNGPGPMPPQFKDCEISYPITFAPKTAVEEILSRKYKIRFSLKEEGGYTLINNEIIDTQYSYFCDLKI